MLCSKVYFRYVCVASKYYFIKAVVLISDCIISKAYSAMLCSLVLERNCYIIIGSLILPFSENHIHLQFIGLLIHSRQLPFTFTFICIFIIRNVKMYTNNTLEHAVYDDYLFYAYEIHALFQVKHSQF